MKINCEYYQKENKEESRCITDSSIGACIIEKYDIYCKFNGKQKNLEEF